MKRTALYLMVVSFIVVSSAAAQIEDTRSTEKFSNYLRSGSDYGLGLQSIGLFNPSRMTFSHSISSSYISSGGEGVMRNMFMETIGYRISQPLTLTMNIGYLQQPYSTFNQNSALSSGRFMGSAALTWRPRDNMFLHLEVGNIPSYGNYGYYPYNCFVPRYTPVNTDRPHTDELFEED